MLAVVLRDQRSAGSPGHGGTYLLDVVGLFLALTSAIFDIHASLTLLPAGYHGAHRRYVIQAAIGAPLLLAGCALASVANAEHLTPAQILGAAAIPVGIAFGLGGGISLGWHHGADSAGDRIERLNDQDW